MGGPPNQSLQDGGASGHGAICDKKVKWVEGAKPHDPHARCDGRGRQKQRYQFTYIAIFVFDGHTHRLCVKVMRLDTFWHSPLFITNDTMA
jgi:hypothetical protein